METSSPAEVEAVLGELPIVSVANDKLIYKVTNWDIGISVSVEALQMF